MMFYSSSHECNKSFEVTSRRRVTLKTCSMNSKYFSTMSFVEIDFLTPLGPLGARQ